MKKLFILVFLLAVTNLVLAEEKSTFQTVADGIEAVHDDAANAVSTVYSDAKEAVNYLTPKIEAGVISLANGLKTTAEEVFSILVMKQIANSIVYLMFLIISITAFYFAWRISKINKEELLTEDNYGDKIWKPQYITLFILALLIGAGLFISFIVNFPNMLQGFIVPEYGAMKEVVDITKELIGN